MTDQLLTWTKAAHIASQQGSCPQTEPRRGPRVTIRNLEHMLSPSSVVLVGASARSGSVGNLLKQAMLDAARPHCLRLMGPNCIGLMLPEKGLNASFSHIAAPKGDLAFLSQSGALITGILDWAASNGVGFSHVASLGDMADVDFGDMLDYLAGDT